MYASRLAARAALDREAGAVARFWTQVDCPIDAEQCWSWRGRMDRRGDPVLQLPRRSISAARLAWLAVLGEFPLTGKCYRQCSNARCVRPTHLGWRASYRTQAQADAMHDGYVCAVSGPTPALELRAALRAGAVQAGERERAAS